MTRILRNLATLSLTISCAAELSSCGDNTATETAVANRPLVDNGVEAMINDYDKLTKEYVRVSKKLKEGDVSITVKYIELGKRTQQESAHLKQVSAKMTPQQVQRLTSISARTAPYLQE